MQDRTVKLGETLSGLIERGGYSRNRQSILEAIGVSAAALSQYTRDQTRPSFQKLIALADFFGVSLDYLVYGEPVGTPLDPGPLARYIDHSLAEVQARASRHSDLMTRIGRVLADRIDGVAQELVQSPTAGREGLIQVDEVLRIERYCRQADIVAMNLEFDVIELADSEPAAGQFLQVVAANLSKGRKYRFLLPGNPQKHSANVTAFRRLLGQYVRGDHVHGNCLFRCSPLPVVAEIGLYRLDVAALELEEPALFTQFSKYVDDEDRLGYVTRPNDDSNADMLMNGNHLRHVVNAFEGLWSTGVSV